MAELTPEGYKTGVALSTDAIFVADAEGSVIFVNPAGVDLVGEQPIYGQQLASLFETSVDTSQSHIADIFASNNRPNNELNGESSNGLTSQQFIGTVRRADGDRRAVLIRANCAPLSSGDAGIVMAMQDVTEFFRARQAVAKAEQTQKLEALGQLVSGVAHELNNPLSAVIAYAQLVLTNPELPLDERQSVDTILAESRRAAKIVSNLLTFARQHQVERSLVDINTVVRDTVALRRYTLTGYNIELIVDLQASLPLLWVDNFQIQQVLLNLINNAEQALQKWEGRRLLRITTQRDDDSVLVTVTDSGPGMPSSVIDQIFNPFFTTKEVGHGTGLGLAISDGIVREHGGRIRVESTPDSGATFIVKLPLPAGANEMTLDTSAVLGSLDRLR